MKPDDVGREAVVWKTQRHWSAGAAFPDFLVSFRDMNSIWSETLALSEMLP